jgi:hypothetical protein
VGRDGRTALTVAGAAQIRARGPGVFCKPVAVAAAMVRRDGRVQAAGHPADHARLGLAEDRLDELTGEPGVIGDAGGQGEGGCAAGADARAGDPAHAADDADAGRRLRRGARGAARKPGAGALAAALPGADRDGRLHLAGGDRTGAAGAAADLLLAGIDAEHRSHDYCAVTVGDLEVGSIDGSLIRVPGTPAN